MHNDSVYNVCNVDSVCNVYKCLHWMQCVDRIHLVRCERCTHYMHCLQCECRCIQQTNAEHKWISNTWEAGSKLHSCVSCVPNKYNKYQNVTFWALRAAPGHPRHAIQRGMQLRINFWHLFCTTCIKRPGIAHRGTKGMGMSPRLFTDYENMYIFIHM